MIRNQNSEIPVTQLHDDLLNIVHRNRVNAAERFIKHDETRIGHKCTRDLKSPAFTAGKRHRFLFAEPGKIKFFKQFLQTLFALRPGNRQRFQDRHDIFFHSKLPENGRLLRQISHPHSGTLIHGDMGHIHIAETDLTAIGTDQSHNHIETCRFTGSIRAEQSDNFPGTDG